MSVDVMPARVLDCDDRRWAARIVIVTDPDGTEVTVRWRIVPGRAGRWRCGTCGRQTTATCRHTFAAGLVLAEELLGLTRMPELEPTTPTSQEPNR